MDIADIMKRWQRLGNLNPKDLADARLQLHWASQLVAAVANTFLEHESDDSQSNMEWRNERGSLVGQAVTGDRPFMAALQVGSLAIELADLPGEVFASFALTGRTLDQGYDWLSSAIEQSTGGTLSGALTRPTYDLPAHPTGSGAEFTLHAVAAAELARWYANADVVLRTLVADYAGASPVRCWPHHFDIGALIVLEPGKDAETARSIGVGLSPGDHTYDEPYFYVNPYPGPAGSDLPSLADGAHWHTEGWTGAILAASALVEAGTGDAQASRAQGYLHSAVAACLQILEFGSV